MTLSTRSARSSATPSTARSAARSTARAAIRAAALALPVLAAACTVSTGPVGPGAPAGRPPATVRVEGNWAPSDGASIATFQNGAFVNRAADTGQAFTSGGRYTYQGGDRIAISYTSVVRQSQVNVNCLAVSPAQLNCTNASGARFSLFRRA